MGLERVNRLICRGAPANLGAFMTAGEPAILVSGTPSVFTEAKGYQGGLATFAERAIARTQEHGVRTSLNMGRIGEDKNLDRITNEKFTMIRV